MVSLLKYLTIGTAKDEEKDPLFKMDSKKQILLNAKKMMKRLFPKSDEENEAVENESDVEEVEEEESFESKIEKEIKKGTTTVVCENDMETNIANDFAFFEKSKERPPRLNLLYHALMSIPPTSVEAERNFSAAGFFLTDRRGKLGHKMLDNLCLSRAYFLKEKLQN